jgi:RNA polymerase sigma-70 factor, ECF subfamily
MGNQPSAEALMRSKRDREAFTHFYALHVEALLAHILRRVYDVDLALDLTAETFARAFLRRARFRGSSDAEAVGWLYGIANRELAQYFRRGSAEKRALHRLALQAPRLTEEETERLREMVELDDLRALVRAELERLSEPQREALRLRVIDELQYVEVAKRLEITEGAARARVARGLKALALALDRKPALKEALQ